MLGAPWDRITSSERNDSARRNASVLVGNKSDQDLSEIANSSIISGLDCLRRAGRHVSQERLKPPEAGSYAGRFQRLDEAERYAVALAPCLEPERFKLASDSLELLVRLGDGCRAEQHLPVSGGVHREDRRPGVVLIDVDDAPERLTDPLPSGGRGWKCSHDPQERRRGP